MNGLVSVLKEGVVNFVRCVKVNDQRKSENWNPHLVLKQIQNLGILDTANCYVNVYPHRFLYEDFYKKFQDLDIKSKYCCVNFEKLKSDKADFKKMSENIIKSVDENASTKDVLYGLTTIFIMGDLCNKINKCFHDYQKKKRDGVEVLKQAYDGYELNKGIIAHVKDKAKMMNNARVFFKKWDTMVEALRFKKMLRVINRLQLNYRMTQLKRDIKLRKHIANTVGKAYKKSKCYQLFFKSVKSVKAMLVCKERLAIKYMMAKIKICKLSAEMIFENAWDIIEGDNRRKAAITIQRTLRNFIDRFNFPNDKQS